jgi:hypothetical protein
MRRPGLTSDSGYLDRHYDRDDLIGSHHRNLVGSDDDYADASFTGLCDGTDVRR